MSQEQMDQFRKQMEAQREKVGKDILAVLTTKQREKWDSMQGKKFTFKPPTPQFGGRPGGPGGPGGGGGRGGGGDN